MPEGVLIADRSTASGYAAMHPTAAFSAHRWRSARIPVPGPTLVRSLKNDCVVWTLDRIRRSGRAKAPIRSQTAPAPNNQLIIGGNAQCNRVCASLPALRLLTVATVALLPLSVHGADMPKEGTDSFTNIWMETSPTSPIKVGDRTLGTYEISGVHRSDNGDAMITNMGMRCLGIYEIAGTGPEREHGGCIYADKDGDQIMATFERKTATGGIETLVGGTGKFAGISGTGEWTVLQFPVKADDKLARGIVAKKVHWKLQ
jgi:hypothetical protein